MREKTGNQWTYCSMRNRIQGEKFFKTDALRCRDSGWGKGILMKQKMKFNGKKGFIIIIVLLLLVVGYYYYLSNRNMQKEENVEITEVQELLLRDLNRNYPPTPKEVVKYYFDITKCLYNEKLSEADIEALAVRLEEIFDEELAAHQIRDEYFQDLKAEITVFQSGNRILNYSTSSSTDVDYFDQDGQEWARLYGTFYLQVDKKMNSLDEVFILRRDEDGHWKIYGWEPVEESVTQAD